MPPGITIVGLGPGDRQHWTQAALAALNQAREVYLRTAYHPDLTNIPVPTHSFDDLSKQNSAFNQVYDQIATEIVQLGQRNEGVVYAVPGHPPVDEPTVPRIRYLAKTSQIPVTIIPGLSLLEVTRAALNLDGCHHLQIIEATEIARLSRGRNHRLLGR